MIQVYDNWLPKQAFDYEKRKLGSQTFEEVIVGGKSFYVQKPSVELLEYVCNGISEKLQQKVSVILSFFRLATFTKDTDWRIHSDLNINGSRPDYAAVLYFSEHSSNSGLFGTAFWRHCKYGAKLEKSIADEEYNHVLEVDSNNLEVWSLDSVVSAKENRLLLYDASLFHSKYPNQSWGDDSSGRMVLVMFLNKVGHTN